MSQQDESPYFKYVVDLLKLLLEKDGSDLFVTVGAAPAFKIHGEMTPVGSKPISQEQAEEIVSAVMNDKQRGEFRETKECNFALSLSGIGRFRMNAYVQRGSVGLVARVINIEIPTLEALGLPQTLNQIVMEKRGLVLMVGATGSGKSTSLAAMIGYRNHHSRGHIITIEDPIEYVHPHDQCLVMQREVGVDTDNWFAALKNTLRQAPDVILIGEIRDEDTMASAIAFAETGHLCLATLHSNNADQTIERILNFFPENAHKNVLMNLSLNLHAVISLRLVVGVDGRRLPAVEVLINTPMIRDLMRRGEVYAIKEAMERSLQEGMQSFDQHLFRLYKEGKVELEEALNKADSRDGLALKIRLSEGAEGEHDPYADVFSQS